MTSNPLPVNSSRLGGCTLTGAISVTSHVRDAVTIIHGPAGCSHHNVSLLHASWLDNDHAILPELVSTGLSETDIVFGSEETLRKSIRHAAGRDVRAIFVLSTCIVETIGDDVAAVCAEEYGIPVVPVPTAGFLGGTFHDGVNNALIALAATAGPCRKTGGINIIGEMNLEYEVEENYTEVARLLSLLGLTVNLRFVHDISYDQLARLGAAQLNILRSPALVPVGEVLKERFGTPYIPSFPHGLSGTLSFIRTVAGACGIDGQEAVSGECVRQEEMIAGFSDLANKPASLDHTLSGAEEILAAEELAAVLDLVVGAPGKSSRLPVSAAIGTVGTRRMLHRWRRAIHA
ncbi:nitrogenase component 1 [Methanoregula sp.]|uniref:nitrogenase component 1 n=1 Tax=Methanoregula sp. TaxID=2052170 RepID=UPI00237564DD|nr:nitrogenase component 1 [Methanoregula sp.]MDD1686498.1 nitrogenase component 1 [Methanoregula sp.]